MDAASCAYSSGLAKPKSGQVTNTHRICLHLVDAKSAWTFSAPLTKSNESADVFRLTATFLAVGQNPAEVSTSCPCHAL